MSRECIEKKNIYIYGYVFIVDDKAKRDPVKDRNLSLRGPGNTRFELDGTSCSHKCIEASFKHSDRHIH